MVLKLYYALYSFITYFVSFCTLSIYYASFICTLRKVITIRATNIYRVCIYAGKAKALNNFSVCLRGTKGCENNTACSITCMTILAMYTPGQCQHSTSSCCCTIPPYLERFVPIAEPSPCNDDASCAATCNTTFLSPATGRCGPNVGGSCYCDVRS